MKCEQIKYQLIDFIEDNLDNNIKEEIENHITHCPQCEAEYIQLGKLLQEISKTEWSQPSDNLKNNFYQMLEAEKISMLVKPLKPLSDRISFKHFYPYLKMAAIVIIFMAIGILIGTRVRNNNYNNQKLAALQNEVTELQQNISLISLTQPTASKRIQAIQAVNKQTVVNTDIIDALINTMNTDANVNVRMTAMYALTKYSDDDNVRTALIASLNIQTDPLLQITLINILAGIQDSRAKEPIQKMLNNNDLPEVVKQQAETGLKAFS